MSLPYFHHKLSHFIVFFTKSHCLTIVVGLLLIQNAFAQNAIREFQTTRLKSTAGTGVGSILMDEATILNPAGLGFYQNSSLYYQRNKGQYQEPQYLGSSSSIYRDRALILSDGNGAAAGSISYASQKADLEKRKTLGLALAGPVSENSALGISYRRTREDIFNSQDELHQQKHNEFSFGVNHVLAPNFSYGILIRDPLKKRSDNPYATIGLHYFAHEFIAFMLDFGADYTNEISDTYHYRGAIQVMFFNDFFVRAGYFHDELRSETGNGIGLSWIGPRLMFEFAVQNIQKDVNIDDTLREQKLRESSFSLSYRF